MVKAVAIISKNSGLPLYSRSFGADVLNMDESLLGGLISAVVSFGESLQIGRLTNFDTATYKMLVSCSAYHIVTLLFNHKDDPLPEAHSVAGQLIDEFEHSFPQLLVGPPPREFDTHGFDLVVDKILSVNKKNGKPFYYKALEWAKKEFGGEPLLHQQQYNHEEVPISIDLVMDRGERKEKGFLDIVAEKIIGEDFKRDMTYIKVIDGQAGGGEVKEFLKSCSTFGRRKKAESGSSTAFPSMAVIVAKSYSPTVERFIETLPKKGKNHVLMPEAAPSIAKLVNMPPKSHQCLVQCWLWDKEFPELIME